MQDLQTRPFHSAPDMRGFIARLTVALPAPGKASWLHVQHRASSAERHPESPVEAGAPTATQVLVGVSSPLLARGLESLIGATTGLRCLEAVPDLPQLLNVAARLRDGLVLVDEGLGGQGVCNLLRSILAVAPRARVLLLVDHDQPLGVREAVRAGALGVVARTAQITEIAAALDAVSAGRRHLSAATAAQLAEAITVDELTSREAQVLVLLARGACNKAIARELDVSLSTTKTHIGAIMDKLGARSRTEVVVRANRLGLVRLV